MKNKRIFILNILIFIIFIIITYLYINYSYKKEIKLLKIKQHNEFKEKRKTLKSSPFPIDVVYTWSGENYESTNIRFTDHNELKYSLRSIIMFLPWVNHIYILMNPPKKYPSWMKKCNYITIIDHNDVMNTNIKYTNSNAIETYLPYINNLSEHFIYFNDDVFICRPLEYTNFFTNDGKAVIPESKNIKSNNFNIIPDYNNLNIKFPKFGGWWYHIPINLIKSEMIKYHNEYRDYIKFVRSIHKRETLGCNVCTLNNLHCPCQQQHWPNIYYMKDNNKTLLKNFEKNDFAYYNIYYILYFDILDDLYIKDPMFLCLNNATKTSIETNKKITSIFTKFSDEYFYIKPIHEI
mgnify:CR=1 FL=1